jgi:uncharacterized protein (DUF427 family)
MSLTLGTGPLAGAPGGAFNFELDAPAHRLFFADYPRRLRAVVGDRVLLDSERGKLLYETGIRPVPYAPLEDFDAALLARTDHTTHCPFKGDASYWTVRAGETVRENVRAGETVRENAVWAYEDPLPEAGWLRGYAAVYWDRVDAWFVEEDPVFGGLRDPYHRVDVHESSRPVVVRARGHVVARSERPKLLFETGLPRRVYLPRADVAAGALVPAAKRTRCPYKGEASYWSLAVDDDRIEDAAWSYETPLPEALAVRSYVSFDADGVEVEVGAPRSVSS